MSQNVVSFVATPNMLPLAQTTREIIRTSIMQKDSRYAIREVVPIVFERFADGISLPQIQASVRRTEVYVFYSPPIGNPDLGFAELGKVLDATHFASPKSIKLVLPHFWEGRADRKPKERVSTNTRTLAQIIDRYAGGGLTTFDLHAEQIVLAFDRTPVDDLKGQVLLAEHCRKTLGWKPNEVGIVAADGGAVKRAEKFAEVSGFPFKGFVYKERKEANIAKARRYIGEPLDGLRVIVPDDIIDTGGTLNQSSGLILEHGASGVTACVTHWLGSPHRDPSEDESFFTAEAKFRRSRMRVFALNTIPRSAEYLRANADFLTVISCEPMLASAIAESLTPGGSVSKLSR